MPASALAFLFVNRASVARPGVVMGKLHARQPHDRDKHACALCGAASATICRPPIALSCTRPIRLITGLERCCTLTNSLATSTLMLHRLGTE